MSVIEEAERLRKKGFNIIPIKPDSKIQDGTTDEILDWKKNGCKKVIKEYQGIGIQYGLYSGMWCVDLDDDTLLDKIITNPEKKKNMPIVKTAKGHHLIYKIKPGDEAPGDIKLFNGIIDSKMNSAKRKEDPKDKKQYDKTGRALLEIDIRIKGYTVCPPSIHPVSKLKYEWLNEKFDISEMGWSVAAKYLAELGFYKSNEAKSIQHAIINSPYDYTELIAGGFGRGERRVKLRSFYLKIRIDDFNNGIDELSENTTAKRYRKLNETCIPPLEDNEVEINIASAKDYFTNYIKPELGNKKGEKLMKKVTLEKKVGDMLSGPNLYISVVSNEIWFYKYSDGLWHRYGEQEIRKSIATEPEGIKNHIVNMIRDKVMVRPDEVEGDDENIFDKDYTKAVIKNGVVDLITGEMINEFDPKLRCTSALNVNFDEAAECPRFDELLNSSLDGDEEKINWIWEMFAQSIIRKNLVQKGWTLR